jgi:hypothetical protein
VSAFSEGLVMCLGGLEACLGDLGVGLGDSIWLSDGCWVVDILGKERPRPVVADQG